MINLYGTLECDRYTCMYYVCMDTDRLCIYRYTYNHTRCIICIIIILQQPQTDTSQQQMGLFQWLLVNMLDAAVMTSARKVPVPGGYWLWTINLVMSLRHASAKNGCWWIHVLHPGKCWELPNAPNSHSIGYQTEFISETSYRSSFQYNPQPQVSATEIRMPAWLLLIKSIC